MTDEDEKLYTPETLRDCAGQIGDMRHHFLFGIGSDGADPESEEYYLLALNALEAASRYMRLASIKQSQGIS